jgi:hypothetical protein
LLGLRGSSWVVTSAGVVSVAAVSTSAAPAKKLFECLKAKQSQKI